MEANPARTDLPRAPMPRRRWRRRLLFAGGALAALVLILLALAPTVAGWVAPAYAAGAIAGAINGTATVDRVSLSWFGDQHVGPVIVRDAAGQEVVRAEVEVERGLLALARGALGMGPMDAGTIRVSGRALVVREADGSINLARLIRRSGAPAMPRPNPPRPPAEPASIPKSLAAELKLDGLEVTFVDRTPDADPKTRVLRLRDIRGGGALAAGRPATFTLDADVLSSPDPDRRGAAAGSVHARLTADGIADANGRLTPDKARFEATLDIQGFALAPADGLARMKGALVAAIGERVNATVSASGTRAEVLAEVKADATGLDADLSLRYADAPTGAVVSAARPASLRFRTAGVTDLAPGVRQAMETRGLAMIERWPEVRVTIESLSLRLPPAGADLPDLRGSNVALTVRISEVAGTVITPGADGSAGEPGRPFVLAPATVTLASADLAGPVRIKADGAATIGGEPAGSLVIDLSASGLLDNDGRPNRGLPRNLSGVVLLKGVSTALAAPLAAPFGIDLPADVGPHVDVDLRAVAAAAGPSAVPSSSVDLSVRSAKLTTTAALTLDESGVRGRDQPGRAAVEASLASFGAVASRLAERSGSARVTGGSAMRIALDGINVPFTPGTTVPAPDRASANLRISTGALNVLPTAGRTVPPGVNPVQIRSLEVRAALAPGAPPRITLDAPMAHEGAAFALRADLAMEQLIVPVAGGSARVEPANVKPVGTITLSDVPTSLARLVPSPPAGSGPSFDLPTLLRSAMGRTVTVTVETSVAKARADRLNARVAVESEGVRASVAAGLLPERIAVDAAEARATLTPRLADDLLSAFAPMLDPRPALAGPATLKLVVDPFRVPIVRSTAGASAIDLAGAGELWAKLTLDGRLIMRGLTLPGADGAPRDIGPAGLEALEASVKVAASALVVGGTPGSASATLAARLLAEQDRLAELSASATASLAAGAPAGPVVATLRLSEVRTAALDRILDRPGLASEFLGASLTVDASAEAQLPPPGITSALDRATVSANVSAPKLNMPRPLKASLTPAGLALDSPMVVQWTMEPAFADRFALGLEPPEGGGPPREPLVRFTGPTVLTVSVYKLGLATGDAPMKPGAFALDAAVESPIVPLATSDGTSARFTAFKARVSQGQQPGSIGFSFKTDAADGQAPLEVTGGIYQVCDEAGRLTPERAAITARASASGFPTALADALARQRGLLVELLGPTMTLKAEASGVAPTRPGEGGKVDAEFSSPRARAGLKGAVRDGRFVAAGPVTVNLDEITTDLGERLVSGLPAVAAFEKRREDGPATLAAQGLIVPIDGDLAGLNGDFTFTFGLVRFQSGGTFRNILRALAQREQGSLGRRVAPFKATIRDGVMTYERYTLPLGEFSVDTLGTVDLVNRRLNVVTYIPLGALTDEAAGMFNTGLGKLLGQLPVLDRATMMPWRTKGSFDSPRTEPDLELFIRQIGSGLNPLKLIPDRKPGG